MVAQRREEIGARQLRLLALKKRQGAGGPHAAAAHAAVERVAIAAGEVKVHRRAAPAFGLGE